MTRTTNRALATLLVALFALAHAIGVGAHECTDGIDNRCAPSMTFASAPDELMAQQAVSIEQIATPDGLN